MTMYEPQEGIHVGRPPCSQCGAAYRLHRDGACPAAWRPTTPAEAERELAAAEASGDAARVFVARGDLQRIRGRQPA